MPMPLNAAAAPAEEEGAAEWRLQEHAALRLALRRGGSVTAVADEHAAHHGAAAAAQAQVEALQDALRRRPQGRRHRRAQEGDAGGPNRGVGHTWRTHGDGHGSHTHTYIYVCILYTQYCSSLSLLLLRGFWLELQWQSLTLFIRVTNCDHNK